MIDGWNPTTQSVAFYVDGTDVVHGYKVNNNIGNVIGDGNPEDIQTISFSIGHTSSSLTLLIKDNGNSWGIRDIRI
jgi:hypothetical protein